jgi:hypothetical protein
LPAAPTDAALPLHFEANRGQTDPAVRFLARSGAGTLFLTAEEAVLVLGAPAPAGGAAPPAPAPHAALRLSFPGANPAPRVTGRDELAGKAHYLIGRDPAQWRTGIPTYGRVHYAGLYPGIDLVYYGNGDRLEYDFVVAPGADPGRIRLAFAGADRVAIDAAGDLVLATAAGEVRQHRPFLYQEFDGVRREVAGGYRLAGSREVAFEVAAYDRRRALVIDPVLAYSTYLGGSSGDAVAGIAVDAQGFAYVAGTTTSGDFPTTPGSFQPVSPGNYNAYVAKLDPTGSALVWSTYLGGSGYDGAAGIAVDAAGHAHLTGFAYSPDFPLTPGALDPTPGIGFVAKLAPSGAALVYSTYLGGDGLTSPRAIALDASEHAYVAGVTASADYQTTPGAFQPDLAGGDDVFVAKLDPSATALVYSTYLGGAEHERPGAGSGIAVDAAGAVYLAGKTLSSDFPVTPGAFDVDWNFGEDAFVAKLDPAGAALEYSTYLGGSGENDGRAIAIDAAGHAFVAGVTYSIDFPTTPGALQPAFGGIQDGFVAKLDPTGSALLYATYLGGAQSDSANGLALDHLGRAYVTGSIQSNWNDDASLTRLSPTGGASGCAAVLGGGGYDSGMAIALGADEAAHVASITLSSDFPVTPGAFQNEPGGDVDAAVARIECPGSRVFGDDFESGDLAGWSGAVP